MTVGGEKALRRRLLDMGITPRTVVTVRKIAPLGDPMELLLRGYVLTLRLEDAQKITIEDPEDLECMNMCSACGRDCKRAENEGGAAI